MTDDHRVVGMSGFARLYDVAMGLAERGGLDRLRNAVVSPARGRVLEIGAGTGLNFTNYRAGVRVIATDPDSAMVERARIRAIADAEALPFRDAAFDEAAVSLALCTIPDPIRALGELRRALKPGGVLRLVEHVRIEHPAFVGRMQDLLTPVWRHIAGGCNLNRSPISAIVAAGFQTEALTAHLGGYLQTITARR